MIYISGKIYIRYHVDMRTITVAQLRQNPGPALAAVERGEEYVILRYRQEIARLVPPGNRREPVSAEAALEVLRETPVDTEWAAGVAHDRVADLGEDPWSQR